MTTCSTRNPKHYSRWKIEPIEFIRANKLDALRANVIKYIMRYDDKDGLKDLIKAKQYLEWIIEDFEKETGEKRTLKDEWNFIRGHITGNLMTENDLIAAERALYEGNCYYDDGLGVGDYRG